MHVAFVNVANVSKGVFWDQGLVVTSRIELFDVILAKSVFGRDGKAVNAFNESFRWFSKVCSAIREDISFVCKYSTHARHWVRDARMQQAKLHAAGRLVCLERGARAGDDALR